MYRPVIYDPICSSTVSTSKGNTTKQLSMGGKRTFPQKCGMFTNGSNNFPSLKDGSFWCAWMNFVDRSTCGLWLAWAIKGIVFWLYLHCSKVRICEWDLLWCRVKAAIERCYYYWAGSLSLSWEKECGGDTSGCILHPDFWWVMYSSTATNTIRIQFGL